MYRKLRMWFCFMVGLDGFQDPRVPLLRSCENDVKKLKDAYYKRIQPITSIVFTRNSKRIPRPGSLDAIDSNTILNELKVVSKRCEKDDNLIVHFSSHGQNIDNELYIYSQTTKVSSVNATILSAVRFSDIMDILEAECRAKYILITIDTCFSGAAKGYNITSKVSSHMGETVIVVIAGCSYDQQAIEDEGTQLGQFTSNLINCLDTHTKRCISVKSIYNCISIGTTARYVIYGQTNPKSMDDLHIN